MKISFTILLTVLAVGYATAQEHFREWDRDQDGYITDYEFQVQLKDNKYFNTYDANEDGQIDDLEWDATCKKCVYLKNKYHEKWDTNGDGVVYEDEFINGVYGTWDSDNDGYIASQEYSACFPEWEVVK